MCFEDTVPTSLHAYANVFSETAFDSLPERHKWDHAIELECEPSSKFCKVYPMTLTDQTEMDTFLEEALATGRIRQSKSPLRASVFFIKKKDGKLRFIQDYPPLNAITRKNRYPVRGHLSISLPYLLYSLLSSPTLSTLTPLCAYVHPLTTVPIPIVDDICILKLPTLTSSLYPHLNRIRQASDTWGQVHAILRHPLRHMDLWKWEA
jgi:hypothetical protein